MKKLLKLLRQLILAPFILYIYNLIAISFNIIIPINFFTIIVVGLLGIPGLVLLLVFKLLVF